MTTAELTAFKQQLLALKTATEARAEHNQDALKTVELDQNRMGRLTRMDALQGQQMAQATERRRLLLIKKIEGALLRIEQGHFGDCYRCGEAIQTARLRFDPTLTRCLNCSEIS